uniref:7TM_GPCR_Srx domain-containing protein n=1 Tax=Rhabditophanes sp. KR3021 TaxID=114890 RepID=A0AC35TFZ0_9BILA
MNTWLKGVNGLISLIGITINVWCFWFHSLREHKKIYHYLFMRIFVSNAMTLTIERTFEIVSFISDDDMIEKISFAFGSVSLFFYYLGTYLRLFLAVARFQGCVLGFNINEIYTIWIRKHLLVVLFLITLATIVLFTIPNTCTYHLNDSVWEFELTDFCKKASFFIDFILVNIILAICLISDFLVLAKVFYLKYKRSSNVVGILPQVNIKNLLRNADKMQYRLVFQTLFPNLLLCGTIFMYYFLEPQFHDDANVVYVLKTMTFTIYHAVDGLVNENIFI